MSPRSAFQKQRDSGTTIWEVDPIGECHECGADLEVKPGDSPEDWVERVIDHYVDEHDLGTD